MAGNKSRLVRTPEERFRNSIFLVNNPVLIEGLALAPVVAAALTLRYAIVLAITGATMIFFTRIAGNIIIPSVAPRFRMLTMAFLSAFAYIPAAYIFRHYFALDATNVGIYLPMIVVDGIIISRASQSGREKIGRSVVVAFKTAFAYSFVIILVGFLRELLTYNTIYGLSVHLGFKMSIFGTTAGGYILVALLAALFQALSSDYKRYVSSEVMRDV